MEKEQLQDTKQRKKHKQKQPPQQENQQKQKQQKRKKQQQQKRKNQEKKRRQNLTVLNSIRTNYLSWICILVSIFILSYPNLGVGYFTFFALMLLSYFWHALSHVHKHCSIIHHYHHEHNNFFSHFSQMCIELSLGFLPLVAQHFGVRICDPWIVIYFTLFYTTIHNINYGTFHVNRVHREHHEELFCNLGPDICDVAFGTKSSRDTHVENTNHYIPNILIITLVILLFQYLCKNEDIFQWCMYYIHRIYVGIFVFLSISTGYLTFMDLWNHRFL